MPSPASLSTVCIKYDWRYKYRTNSKDYDYIRDTFFQPRVAAPVVQHWNSPRRLPLCCFIRGLYADEARRGQNDLYRGGVGRAVRRLRAEGVQCAPVVVGRVHGRCSGLKRLYFFPLLSFLIFVVFVKK